MTNSAPRERPARLLVLASKAPGLAPSQRFRFEQWAPLLKRDYGLELDLLPFESPQLSKVLYQPGHFLWKSAWVVDGFARRLGAVVAARGYDAIIIHREAALIGPAIYERLLRWIGKPVIFDFDDAIWMQQPDQKNSIFSTLHFHRKTKSICRLATAVAAGNGYLASYAQQVNDNVHIVPTTIEIADYPLTAEPPQQPFVICWSGSTTTLPHFEHARAALEAVASRVPTVVKIICNRPPARAIAGAEMRFIPWSPEVEGPEIASSHVGIMPLPDNEFSRGKCGLKALQYMAAARPVIVSPVGVNEEIVHNGENGFVAATDAEFVHSLMALAGSPQLRAKVGAAARQRVEKDYSASVGAEKFASVVRSAVA